MRGAISRLADIAPRTAVEKRRELADAVGQVLAVLLRERDHIPLQEGLGDDAPRLLAALGDVTDAVHLNRLQAIALENASAGSPPVQRTAAACLAALGRLEVPRHDAIVDALLETLTLRTCEVLAAVAGLPEGASGAVTAQALLELRPAWPVAVLASVALAASDGMAATAATGARADAGRAWLGAAAVAEQAGDPLFLGTFELVGTRAQWSNAGELQGLLVALRAVAGPTDRVWTAVQAVTSRWPLRLASLGWAVLALVHAADPAVATAAVELCAGAELWRALGAPGTADAAPGWRVPLWRTLLQQLLTVPAHGATRTFVALDGACLEGAAAALEADPALACRPLALAGAMLRHAVTLTRMPLATALAALDGPNEDPLVRGHVAVALGTAVAALLRYRGLQLTEADDRAWAESTLKRLRRLLRDSVPAVRRRAVAGARAATAELLPSALAVPWGLHIVEDLLDLVVRDSYWLVRADAALALTDVLQRYDHAVCRTSFWSVPAPKKV